jgi:tetratricopeptide (TPR) repeat protein
MKALSKSPGQNHEPWLIAIMFRQMFTVLIAFGCCIGALIFLANKWVKEYRAYRAAKREGSLKKEPPAPLWAWLVTFAIVGSTVAVYALTGWNPALIFLVVLVGAIVVMLSVFAVQFRRKFPIGDPDQEILRVRNEIETKGPSAGRWNYLALLLCVQKNWPESLHAFEEAERLAVPTPIDTANKGTVLWKIGRLGEAEQHLEAAHGKDPNNFTTAVNYCLLLAEFKKIDRANELLGRVEEINHRHFIWSLAERRRRKKWLKECREQVNRLRASTEV